MWRKTTAERTEPATPPPDRTIADVAARQHGVISLDQLRASGFSSSGVRSRVAAGRLHRVHGKVYAVGHPVLSIHGRWMAAVLACGEGAVLSHRSAAALWELRACGRSAIDVTSPRRTGRDREQIDVHSGATLEPTDVTIVRGVPCTTVARTLLDLADVVDRRAVERACDQAEVLRLLDARSINHVLGRANGRRGAAILRAILAEHDIGTTLTRRELEERFLIFCDGAGIPRPHVNAWVTVDGEAFEVDFMWPEQRVIVETDGWSTHGTRRAFERDRRRDQRLLLAGWRVVRCTWRQVVSEPDDLATTILTLLSRCQA